MKHPPSEIAGSVRLDAPEPQASRGASVSGERRLAFDVAALGMGIIAMDGRWESANVALAELVGRSRDEMLSLSLEDLTHPADVAADRHGLARLLRGDIGVLEHEKRMLHRSGAPIWVLQQVTVSQDNAGRPTHFIWQGRDLTEDRRMREARSEAEERLRAVVAHAPIVLWAVDLEGAFTLAEGRGLATMGPIAERMAIGRSAFELYRDVPVIQAGGRSSTGDSLLRRALAGESCVGLAEIGEARYDTRLEPLRDAAGAVVGVIGVATDVTERVRAEAASRTSSASFRALIERTPEMIIVHREGRIVYVNPAAAAALRCGEPAQLLGRPLAELVHPDEHGALAERIAGMTRTGQPAPTQEFRLLQRGAGYIATELVGVPLIFDGEPAVVSIGRDVAERKAIQAHILQTDRLVALGTLAAGVAHEINNPLTYVMGNLELVSRLLRARADESRRAEVVNGASMATELEELSATLGVARDGAERVRRIVRDLTTFAHSEREQRALLDVRAVLGPVLNLVSNEIRQRARLAPDLHDVPLVEADEARLGQVLMNLLLNAAQAIPEGDAGAHEIGVTTYTDDAGRAVVEVRDTGSGIPEDVLGRIFEPFFTTKPVGLGTGLGLSICHGTVTRLGGEITVRSTPGAGSVFRITLPAAPLGRREVAAAAPAPEPRPASRRPRARILVIDDEPLITASLHRALAHHAVDVVIRAEEALARILAGDRFDVILCDLLMPGMTGMELADALAGALPEQAARMVFMTGGAFTTAAREFLDRVPNLRLEKPLDLERLDALIQVIAETAHELPPSPS